MLRLVIVCAFLVAIYGQVSKAGTIPNRPVKPHNNQVKPSNGQVKPSSGQRNSSNPVTTPSLVEKDAKPGQFPYVVSLQNEFNEHRCSGSIIHDSWILTTAYCANSELNQITQVVVGIVNKSTDGQTYNIDEIISHPDYHAVQEYKAQTEYSKDLALVKVTRPIRFSKQIKLVKLGRVDSAKNNLTAVYWLKERDEALKYLQTQPKTSFSTHVLVKIPTDSDCLADSGGPLVKDGQLVGVHSYGDQLCREAETKSYVKVDAFRDWINSHIVGSPSL